MYNNIKRKKEEKNMLHDDKLLKKTFQTGENTITIV